MFKNRVTELLNLEHPIIQAPMAGGVTTSALVAAVSNAGALGMIGAGYMSPTQLREQIREIKLLTLRLHVPMVWTKSKASKTPKCCRLNRIDCFGRKNDKGKAMNSY